MSRSLRENQSKAISKSIDNNFSSGVHFHATGTGKSWISLEIILKYHEINPTHNIFWICEQKSILIEQFSKQQLKNKGYLDIYQKFIVHNYSQQKLSTWHESINVSKYWGKPILVIINRAFLVSQDKYKQITVPIQLIIHDECHSISNKTTQLFYEYIQNKFNSKCIGFSATPNLDYEPYKNIISSYSIYDAYLDDVIVPPKIIWYSSQYNIDIIKMIELVKNEIHKLVYKKIVIWCGLIDECYCLSKLWKDYFPDFDLYTDTSIESDNQNYLEFEKKNSKAVLFCACKHREGSDIRNLDCCIFFDKVQNRTPKTFIQCLGRVLRHDKLNLKKYGLIIDFNAQSSIKICDRINEYLNLETNIFPWNYDYQNLLMGKSKKKVTCHQLTFIKNCNLKSDLLSLEYIINNNFNKESLTNRFIRKVNGLLYQKRLDYELDLIISKNLGGHLILATEILKLTNNLPHVTRGSCGSSLVCYLMGISNIDPIKYNISFARFLNEYRDNLPDIDFDFPHFLRDDVFIKLYQHWPGQVARISNHVHYHQKSAQRQALREVGIRKFIGKNDIQHEISRLSDIDKNIFKYLVKNLTDTFKNYSLHCGGIVFFTDGVPSELKLNNHKMMNQVVLNKYDVSKNKQFKIDILSSRAISQLYYSSSVLKNNLELCDFTNITDDPKTYQLLSSGNNIGITLAESPLMRKALMNVKPKNIEELAVCLAIIRPAAKDARNSVNYQDKFIFDDDAIQIISKIMECDESEADKYRRGFAKKDIMIIKQLKSQAQKSNQISLLDRLKNLRKYSFCKSHAISYAQLVWKLSYLKANYPKIFWKATLLYCQTSYRKWVHYYEAILVGINHQAVMFHKDKSVYSKKKKEDFENLNPYQQMRKYNYWKMSKTCFFPDCYYYYDSSKDNYCFRGIIASCRTLTYNHKERKTKMVFYIGVAKQKYIEVIATFNDIYFKQKYIGIFGCGTIIDKDLLILESKSVSLF